MRLKSIHLQNFMCYRNSKVKFPNFPIVNIYGIDLDRNTSNGIGKSALKEAVLFALFGKTKVALSDIPRKGAKGACTVTLIFQTDDKEVEVKRTYRKKISSLDIKVNNEPITSHGVRDKVKYLGELIGMNYEGLVNFSIFDSIRFEDLSSLSSSEIKRLLKLTFNYDNFNKTYVNLKDTLRTKESVLTQMSQRKTHYYSDRRLSTLKQALMQFEHHIKGAHKKTEILNKIKYKLGSAIASKSTIVSRNSNTVRMLLSKNACPVCLTSLDNKVQILNSYQTEINECKQIITKYSTRVERANRYLRKANEFLEYTHKRTRKIIYCIMRLEAAKEHLGDIKEIQIQYNKYKAAADVLQRFEMYVLEHYVQYLEQIINDYLTRLTDISCKISFLKQGSIVTRSIDKFYMKLFRDNKEYSYMSLSSGERMLIAYAFKLAINTLNFRDTFLFVDEGLNKLDLPNRHKLLKMLQDSPFHQVFLVSHNDKFEGIPIIHITKKDNESTIQV